METNPEPRPSKLLLANSVIVIGACMYLAAGFIAALTVVWDPSVMFGGLILLPLPLALGFQQYFGAFRRRAKSAWAASSLAFFLSILALMFGACFVALGIANSKFSTLTESIAPLAFGLYFLAIGYLNRRWHFQLQTSGWSPVKGQFRITTRELLSATAVVAGMLAMTAQFIRDDGPQFAVDVTREESGLRLPENASRVSYAHGGFGSIAYEFDTDEASFRKWVEAGIGEIETGPVNGPISEIDARNGIMMTRYTFFISQAQETGLIVIEEGLTCLASSGDQWIHAAFDRKTNRAYYNANYH